MNVHQIRVGMGELVKIKLESFQEFERVFKIFPEFSRVFEIF